MVAGSPSLLPDLNGEVGGGRENGEIGGLGLDSGVLTFKLSRGRHLAAKVLCAWDQGVGSQVGTRDQVARFHSEICSDPHQKLKDRLESTGRGRLFYRA